MRVVGGCLRWRPDGGGGCGGLLGPRQRRAGVEAVVAAVLVGGNDGCPEGWGESGAKTTARARALGGLPGSRPTDPAP